MSTRYIERFVHKRTVHLIATMIVLALVAGCGAVEPTATSVSVTATRPTVAPAPPTPTDTPNPPTETATLPPTATPRPTATRPTVAPTPTATEAPGFTLYPEPGIRVDVRTYGGRLTDWGYDILLLDDGGTLIVGQADNTGPSHRIFPGKARLIRTDAEGDVIWQKDYGGEVDSMFYCPIQTGDDEYVILGQIAASYTRDEEDIYLVKIDGEGNEIWSQTYGGRGMDHGKMVRQTADGGFILVGDRADEFPSGGLYQSDLVLIKTDAEGNEVWTRTYGDKILYVGWGVAQTPDGGYVLIGWEAKTIPDRDVIAIKTDEMGEVEWTRTWDLDPGDRDGGFDMILTADGHIVIACIQSMDSGPRGAVLIKVDLEGNEVWVKDFDAGGEGSEFWDIMEDTDGGYVMAGGRFLSPIDRATGEAVREGLIIKTDPDGEVLWQHTISSGEYESTLLSSAVVLPGRGYIFVGAATPSGGECWDMLWLKLTTDRAPVLATGVPVSPTPANAPILGAISVDTVDQVECLHTLSGHSDRVCSVAFSPDGALLASGSDDGTIKLWDVESGQEVHTLGESNAGMWDVDFSLDGALLATGSVDQSVKLWDVASGQLLHTLAGHTSAVFSVAFAPDGAWLASGSARPELHIKLWDVESGQEVRTLTGQETDVHNLAFSPDGTLLAAVGPLAEVKLWDVASGQVTYDLGGHNGNLYGVAFSADGTLLASSGDDGTVRLWDVETGRALRSFRHGGEGLAVVFSPDGSLLAYSGADGQVYLWGIPR